MRPRFLFPVLAAFSFGLSSCAHENPAPAGDTPTAAVQPSSPFRPTATIQDLMESVVDPAADFLWESVATISNASGTVDKQPRTDAEWQEVRNRAIQLVEASNLLLIEGRKVVAPGKIVADSNLEGVQTAEQIEKSIAESRAAFIQLAHGLHNTASAALAAIDRRDIAAYLKAGEELDGACEDCHRTYWYPNAPEPTQKP